MLKAIKRALGAHEEARSSAADALRENQHNPVVPENA
jgi:hypothetical protein